MNDPNTRLMTYLISQGHGSQIVGLSVDDNRHIDFAPGVSSADQATIQALANAFDLTPVPNPNIEGFKDAIFADVTLSADARIELVTRFFPLLEEYADNSPMLKSGWALAVSAYSNTWLTADVVANIQAKAITYNVPIV